MGMFEWNEDLIPLIQSPVGNAQKLPQFSDLQMPVVPLLVGIET